MASVRGLGFLGVLSALVGLAGSASAQAPVAPGKSGFGDRDAFVLSVERMFGYQQQEIDDRTHDSVGLHPVYWGHLGLFSVSQSGLTFGALLGASYLRLGSDSSDPLDDGDDTEVAILRVAPRIGYAGSVDAKVGYWLRAGPSALFAITEGNDAKLFALGFEALAVVTPVAHVGILFGPNVDIHLYGRQGDEKTEYKALGLSAGLLGEFW